VLQPEKTFNTPDYPRQQPTMDGFVTDYISMFAAELGKPSTYVEYAQFMTGYTPGQMPVLSAIARGFATFDHWFCDVPSCTFPNRSFFYAATQRLRGEHDTAGIVHRAQHRRDRVTAPPGAMRSHGSC
jgi:phospholipase C